MCLFLYGVVLNRLEPFFVVMNKNDGCRVLEESINAFTTGNPFFYEIT